MHIPAGTGRKLRKQVTELEDKKAEGIVEDIRRAAQSYMTV